MDKQGWNVLIDDKIIKILDGDMSIGKIKIDNKDTEIMLQYLSGPTICNLSAEIGFPMDYLDEDGNAKSRWAYFEDMLVYAIENKKVSVLLNKLLSRQSAGKALDYVNENNNEVIDYVTLIPRVQRLAITSINNILGINEKRIAFSKKQKRWYLYNLDLKDDDYTQANKESKNSMNNVVSTKGFYILPFTSKTESVMHAIQDELKNEKIDFQLNKSGDIFDGTRNNDILSNIIEDIKKANIIVADLSGKNPNVYYELGLAHAWNKKVIIICSKESYKKDYNKRLPFDIATKMILFYGTTYDDIKKLSKSVVRQIQAILKN
ncbi:hypothetical protein [Lactobacillus taiwanensis]|uniref:hypothetical protein n=1 Tax=Lactobacillus taiwanensis TaxID=508451 RepID=UPI0025B01754|nr:hypothetical protein [Lactobacillus taiwanensis]